MTRLLIIGGSDAGISAALRARELSPEVQVSVVVADRYPNYSICGIPYYLSGEVRSAADLAHRKAADIEATGVHLLLDHRAESVDAKARTVSVRDPQGRSEAIGYDRLILATGAVSVLPDIPGLDLPGVFPLRWIGDTLAIEEYMEARRPASATLVGGGYIGMEMAEALTRKGLEVTVVEYAPSVLTTVDADLGAQVRETLIRHAVRVVNGVGVEAIVSQAGRLQTRGTGGFTQTSDMVLVVVGARPMAELAASAGVPTGLHGAFKVNRRMQTGVPHLYAAGDCVETWHHLLERYTYLPLGTTAHKQGRIAGENAVGGAREFAGSLGTQSVKIFDLVVARTGLNDRDAKAAGLAPLSVDTEAWDHKAYYPGARPLKIRVTGERDTGRLLGAQILGHYGTEVSKRIDVFATALFHGMDVDGLNDLDLSYTPPLSSPWDPIQMSAQNWSHRRERP